MNEGGESAGVGRIVRALRLHNRAAERAEPLDRFVGSWAIDGRCRPFGAGSWLPVTGEADGRWIVDGRYMQLSMAADMAGVVCNSVNFLCYDPLVERFMDVWFDNVGAGLYRASGTFAPSTRILALERQFASPLSGRRETVRTLWDFGDLSAIRLQLLMPGGEDEWRPFVELVLRRTPETPADSLRRAISEDDDPIPVLEPPATEVDEPDSAPPAPLDRLLGEWIVRAEVDLLGTGHRTQAVGTATGHALMGARFVQLDVSTADAGAPPYRAYIVLARNPVTGAFESAMFDNALASIVMLDGAFDAERGVLREEGEYTNPAFGTRHALRTEWRFAASGEIELIWEAPLGLGGSWKRVMRVAMRRAGA